MEGKGEHAKATDEEEAVFTDENLCTTVENTPLAAAQALTTSPCLSQTPVTLEKYLFPTMKPEARKEKIATTNTSENTIGASV